jgi:hypothetical protein
MGGVGDFYFREVDWKWVLEGGIKMIDRSTRSTMPCYASYWPDESQTVLFGD